MHPATLELSQGGRGEVARALEELKLGRPVLLVGTTGQVESCSIVVAAELVTASAMAFVVRHTSGFVCVALDEDQADRLDLPPMVAGGGTAGSVPYAVTVDARTGISTGISAKDRAHTARLLADPRVRADELLRPGHLVPIRTGRSGVIERLASEEAAVDLARLAGLAPAAVMAEVVSSRSPISMCGIAEIDSFAMSYGLPVVSVDDVLMYRRQVEVHVERRASTDLSLAGGSFLSVVYRAIDRREHFALLHGDATDQYDRQVVYVHGECVEGDVFGATRCQCRAMLEQAFEFVSERGSGVVLYLRGDAGQPDPLATLDGRQPPSHSPVSGLRCLDEGQLSAAAHIMRDLRMRRPRLLGGDASLQARLHQYGLSARLHGRGLTAADGVA